MKPFSEVRRQAGLSIEEAGEILKLSVETVGEYERGARLPQPREINVLKGLVLSQSPKGVKIDATESNSI